MAMTPQKILIRKIRTLSENEICALITILGAMEKGKDKFPLFAKNSLCLAGNVVTEECGELAQAIVQYVDEDKEFEPIREEASHVGGVIIRLLCMLQELESGQDDTKKLIDTIISWEKDLGEYQSLENRLKAMYKIKAL